MKSGQSNSINRICIFTVKNIKPKIAELVQNNTHQKFNGVYQTINHTNPAPILANHPSQFNGRANISIRLTENTTAGTINITNSKFY